MTKKQQPAKVWLADRFMNCIRHRALSKFEQRNPTMVEMHYEVCSSWPDAHAAILRMREESVEKAAKEFTNAAKALKRAQSMTPPKEVV